MLYDIPTIIISLVLFVAMLICNWAGFRIARYQLKKNPEKKSDELGAVEGSLLGLLALMLAFTFSMSATRYETRRDIFIEEVNDISKAILRSDLYPDSIRSAFRADFKNYLEARIAYFDVHYDEDKIEASLKQANEISSRIWQRAAALGQLPENLAKTNQMIPALNDMIDIVTTRDASRTAHVPESIIWGLFILCISGSFMIGYGAKRRKTDWVMIIAFALMTTITVYLILDLDRPRRGVMTLDTFQEKMIELRGMFDQH